MKGDFRPPQSVLDWTAAWPNCVLRPVVPAYPRCISAMRDPLPASQIRARSLSQLGCSFTGLIVTKKLSEEQMTVRFGLPVPSFKRVSVREALSFTNPQVGNLMQWQRRTWWLWQRSWSLCSEVLTEQMKSVLDFESKMHSGKTVMGGRGGCG